MDIATDGTMVTEWSLRMGEGAKVPDVLKSTWKERLVSVRAKIGMFNSPDSVVWMSCGP